MTARTDVIDSLEDAVRTLMAYLDDQDEIAVDAALVVGAHYVDDEGNRQGRVIVFPRNGCQPPYVTNGLRRRAAIAHAAAISDSPKPANSSLTLPETPPPSVFGSRSWRQWTAGPGGKSWPQCLLGGND